MEFKDLIPYAKNAGVVMVGAAGTAAVGFSLLGTGTWVYNKVSGSNVTMGESGEAVFKLGGLLAEWAGIIRGGSKI